LAYYILELPDSLATGVWRIWRSV